MSLFIVQNIHLNINNNSWYGVTESIVSHLLQLKTAVL